MTTRAQAPLLLRDPSIGLGQKVDVSRVFSTGFATLKTMPELDL